MPAIIALIGQILNIINSNNSNDGEKQTSSTVNQEKNSLLHECPNCSEVYLSESSRECSHCGETTVSVESRNSEPGREKADHK